MEGYRSDKGLFYHGSNELCMNSLKRQGTTYKKYWYGKHIQTVQYI